MGLKVYSTRLHRNIERQIHFGLGKSTSAICGVVLFSRNVMVSLFSVSDGALITDNMERVTCKRCLATREIRLRKLMTIEQACPGIFDHEPLCGEKWLLAHALDITQKEIDAQELEINTENKVITLSGKIAPKDRKVILKSLTEGC